MKIVQEYYCSDCHRLHSATHYAGRFRFKAAASQLLEREVRGKFPYHRHASAVAAGMDRGTQRSCSRIMRGGKPGAKSSHFTRYPLSGFLLRPQVMCAVAKRSLPCPQKAMLARSLRAARTSRDRIIPNDYEIEALRAHSFQSLSARLSPYELPGDPRIPTAKSNNVRPRPTDLKKTPRDSGLEAVHDVVWGTVVLWRHFIPPPYTTRVNGGARVRVTGPAHAWLPM